MKQSLSFAWKFIPGFLGNYLQGLPENAESVDLPHCPITLPMNYFDEKSYQGQFTYQKRFDAPECKKGLTFLLFEGVMLKAHVYLNGKDLGMKISGWTPLSLRSRRTSRKKTTS
jgi:beta-galactosidase